MKYNTISGGGVVSEGKKPSLTIYADMELSHNTKITNNATDKNNEIDTIRSELETVQKALKIQTKRCRQLVTEYTKRLQIKEQQYQSEKTLRNNQLANVLRALLIFEARLRQEQKFISLQLQEKDCMIKKQGAELKKLLLQQYCKNCNQYYSTSPNVESLDSSSEYVVTDYQSSNFESMDSSSDIYATVSEKSFHNMTDNIDASNARNNNGKMPKSSKKIQHLKVSDKYYNGPKLRTDSPCSNEDNTSGEFDNLDVSPSAIIAQEIHDVSGRIENIFKTNLMATDPKPVTDKIVENVGVKGKGEKMNNLNGTSEEIVKKSNITDTIPVFAGGEETNNDNNWYASVSDPEDDEQRNIYRNNPVLECMNQILLQNISDAPISPPKTPSIDRKQVKNKKTVKFSDEEDGKHNQLTKENLREQTEELVRDDYYETPIQKVPNFYETPQSIYSNDYEQILSKCSGSVVSSISSEKLENRLDNNTLVISGSKDQTLLDPKFKPQNNIGPVIIRKKLGHIPPALPPKPPNLLAKCKLAGILTTHSKDLMEISESEADYCSISELNLPAPRASTSNQSTCLKESNCNDCVLSTEETQQLIIEDVPPSDGGGKLVVKKCVEKLNIQMAKQTSIKQEQNFHLVNGMKKSELEIPKLPQVSEIIIPEETPEALQQDERITHDNYVKNNSQILKQISDRKCSTTNNNIEQNRSPIAMSASVSSLINGFNNNHKILTDNGKKQDRISKLDKKLVASFENLENCDLDAKIINEESDPANNNSTNKCNGSAPIASFENFDLTQNFEEFKLDECEIEEFNVDEIQSLDGQDSNHSEIIETKQDEVKTVISSDVSNSIQEKSMNIENESQLKDTTNYDVFKKHLEIVENLKTTNGLTCKNDKINMVKRLNHYQQPSYEHFLECSGLSSKSILTPSRLLSNHKSMLKPKDVKLRSKIRTNNNLVEYHLANGTNATVKYWSEPYI